MVRVRRSRAALVLGLLLLSAGLVAVVVSVTAMGPDPGQSGRWLVPAEQLDARGRVVCPPGSGEVLVAPSRGVAGEVGCLSLQEQPRPGSTDLPALITAIGGAVSMTMGSAATLVWTLRGRQGAAPPAVQESVHV